MWPDMVEFRSVSLEVRRRKKKEKRKKESVVKYKSADMYVGRPKERRSNRGKTKSADRFVVRLKYTVCMIKVDMLTTSVNLYIETKNTL